MKSFIVIILSFTFLSCNELTHRKAFFKKDKDIMPFRENDNLMLYPDGSIGNCDCRWNSAYIYADGTYTFEHQRFYINPEPCKPARVLDRLVGSQKGGKRIGKWYTYSRYILSVPNDCKKQFRKYASTLDRNLDTSYISLFKLVKIETYKDGFLDGDFVCFDFHGKIIYKTKFVNGTGYYKHFYPPYGIMQEEGQYVNGFKDGKWRTINMYSDTFNHYYKRGIEIQN